MSERSERVARRLIRWSVATYPRFVVLIFIFMDYPYVKCLNPKVVYNSYTKQRMVVPCGHCLACNGNKANVMRTLCEAEQSQHPYTLFLTLTYSNEYVPRLLYEVDPSDPFNVVVRCSDVDKKRFGLADDDSSTLYTCSSRSLSDIHKVSRRQELNAGNMYTLCKRDIQLFNKRLRKYLFDETQHLLRFYAVGEYGPVRLRPHYHLLVFLDFLEDVRFIEENLSKIWPFGRVDCSLSRGDCSSYVATYVNSNYSLPKCFEHKPLLPFNLHSDFLGALALRSKKKAFDEMSVRQIANIGYERSGRFMSVPLWRSLERCLFPKIYGYGSFTHCQRVYAYRSLYYLRQVFGACSLVEMTKRVLHYCRYGSRIGSRLPSVLDFFLSFNRGSFDYASVVAGSPEYEEFNRVYHILLTSKHFLDFCCNGDYSYLVSDAYVSRIEDYYDCKSLATLSRFYGSMVDFADWKQFLPMYYNFYGVLDVPAVRFLRSFGVEKEASRLSLSRLRLILSDTPSYLAYNSEVEYKFHKHTKHKFLNDQLTNYFNYG